MCLDCFMVNAKVFSKIMQLLDKILGKIVCNVYNKIFFCYKNIRNLCQWTRNSL